MFEFGKTVIIGIFSCFVYINAILCSTTRNQYHRCCWSWLPAAACLLLGNADFMWAFSEHASIINDFVGAKRTDFICMISGNGTQMDAMQFLVVVACFLWGGGAAEISGFRERERETHTMGDFILISFRDIFHHCIENAFRQLFQ